MKASPIPETMQSPVQNILNWLNAEKKPVLVEVFEEGCTGCRVLEPEMVEISRKYEGRLRTRRIDRLSVPELMQEWEVRSAPALVLFTGGAQVWKHEGILRMDQIEKILNETLAND